jgi:Domain of unknown function (DUF5122) beta-propeller
MKKILLSLSMLTAHQLIAQNYIVDNTWGVKIHSSATNLTESNCRAIEYVSASNEYLYTANEYNTIDQSSSCTLNKVGSNGSFTTVQTSIANNKNFPIPLSGTAFCTTWFPISDKIDINIAALNGGMNSFLTVVFTGQLNNVAVYDIAAASSGGYYIVGQATTPGNINSAYIAKISSTGALETVTNLAFVESTARCLKVLSDGSIIVAGHYINGNGNQSFVKKLNYAGGQINYDVAFNSSGTFYFHYDVIAQPASETYALEIDNAGNIYVGGECYYSSDPSTPRMCYARINNTGTVANTFNIFGTARSGHIYCMRKMNDGNILLGGASTINSAQGLYLEKINSSTGLIDTTFTFKSAADRAFFNLSTSNEEVIFGISQGNSANEYVICGQNFQKGFYTKIKSNGATNIASSSIQHSTLVYPNPSNGQFTIASSTNIKNVYSTDIIGNRIMVSTIGDNQYFIGKSGIYYLEIILENNSSVYKKVIIN